MSTLDYIRRRALEVQPVRLGDSLSDFMRRAPSRDGDYRLVWAGGVSDFAGSLQRACDIAQIWRESCSSAPDPFNLWYRQSNCFGCMVRVGTKSTRLAARKRGWSDLLRPAHARCLGSYLGTLADLEINGVRQEYVAARLSVENIKRFWGELTDLLEEQKAAGAQTNTIELVIESLQADVQPLLGQTTL